MAMIGSAFPLGDPQSFRRVYPTKKYADLSAEQGLEKA
jgi:hypothetical protein